MHNCVHMRFHIVGDICLQGTFLETGLLCRLLCRKVRALVVLLASAKFLCGRLEQGDQLLSRLPAVRPSRDESASVSVLCSRPSNVCCHFEFIPFSLPVGLVCISLIVSFNLSCNFRKLFHFCMCLFS